MISMPPFYFICSFWGPEFREHFLRLSLASLLAPGNAPALTDREGSRLLVCTTPEDWAAIQDDPTFWLLEGCLRPEFLELRRSVPAYLRPHIAERARRKGAPVPGEAVPWEQVTIGPADCITRESFRELEGIGQEIGQPLAVSHHYNLRILFMSNGHKQGAERAFRDGASAVFLGPDLILAEGSVAELERVVARGVRVALAATLRFDQEKCLAAFAAMGRMAPGRPLTVAPREMVATVFPHMHPETACFEFDSDYFCDIATSSLWRVPGDEGAVVHFLNFYPMLLNFRGVARHHAEYLDEGGTIDGRYIAMHFDPGRDIEVIDDSDRLMLASFTRSSEYYYPVATDVLKRWRAIGPAYKTHLIRKTMWSPMGDPVKRHFYVQPIRFHSQPLTPAWQTIERRSTAVATAAVAPLGPADRALDWMARLVVLTKAVGGSPPSEWGRRLSGRFFYYAGALVGRLPQVWRQRLKRVMRGLGLPVPR
jgi:hypothetical protein